MQPEELSAIRGACLYSLPPNKLGYCGPEHAWKIIEQFISNPKEERVAKVKLVLKEFYGLYTYLDLIAEANSLSPFDGKVIEAYWLGNSLLENVEHASLQKAVLSLQEFGLPKKIAQAKAQSLPEGVKPDHCFHVLFINFVTPKLAPIVKNLSNCLVQWARVKEVLGEKLVVKGIELFSESNELKLREKQKTIDSGFVEQAASGDLITVHWNRAIEKIEEPELQQLKKRTLQNLYNHSLLH